MVDAFTLPDSHALGDLATYVGRAGRVEDGSVRLIAVGGVLAVYVAVIYPAGLLDESPTILGLRTFAILEKDAFDVVVPIASLLVRLERATDDEVTTVNLPMRVNTVTWAAISPPRGGWAAMERVDVDVLDRVARAGIDEIAATVPASGTGEQIVHRVRTEVWGRPIRSAPHIPAGAGFAALALGFIVPNSADPTDATAAVYETGPWTRLSTRRGHVLIKRKAWSLAR
ncbi:hypothetical protein BH11ACT2_BH11ACT2_22510 [soil metagenome]